MLAFNYRRHSHPTYTVLLKPHALHVPERHGKCGIRKAHVNALPPAEGGRVMVMAQGGGISVCAHEGGGDHFTPVV